MIAEVGGGAVEHDPQRTNLILRQRLGREQVQRGGVRVVQERIEHRGVVAHRFTARRAGGDAHVLAPQRRAYPLVLVREEPQARVVRVVERDAGRDERGDGSRAKRGGRGTLGRQPRGPRGHVQAVFALALTPEGVRPDRQVRYERVDVELLEAVAPAGGPSLFPPAAPPAPLGTRDCLLPDERRGDSVATALSLRDREKRRHRRGVDPRPEVVVV